MNGFDKKDQTSTDNGTKQVNKPANKACITADSEEKLNLTPKSSMIQLKKQSHIIIIVEQ